MSTKGRHRTDEAFLIALACGATVENAARSAGLGQRTAARRLRDPEFRRRLQEVRGDGSRARGDPYGCGDGSSQDAPGITAT